MNIRKKQILLALLMAAVIAEIIVLNVMISDITELRNKKVPDAKESYKKTHTQLEQIAQFTGEGKDENEGRSGTLSQGDLNKIATKAGISKSPEFRQYPSRKNQGDKEVQLSEIKVSGISVKPIFAFLKNLEEIGGSSRITELWVTEQRGKSSLFDLRVLFATYTQVGKK